MESTSLANLLSLGERITAARLGGNVAGLLDLFKQLRGIFEQVNLVKLLADLQALVDLLIDRGWLPPAQTQAEPGVSNALFDAQIAEAFSREPDGTIRAEAFDMALILKLVGLLLHLAAQFGIKIPLPGEGTVPLSAGLAPTTEDEHVVEKPAKARR